MSVSSQADTKVIRMSSEQNTLYLELLLADLV